MKKEDRMDDKFPMKCIVCGKGLEFDWPATGALSNPLGGCDFEATGNYGSTVYDPLVDSGGVLRVIICDECLVAKAADILMVRRRTEQTAVVEKTFETYRAMGVEARRKSTPCSMCRLRKPNKE